jgi:small subunit ribosomal protein S1
MSDDAMDPDDESENENQGEEESFAALFESYSAGRGDNLQLGDKISAKIISIGQNNFFVDTGTKIDGVVEKQDVLDENGEFHYAVGDVLELYVIAIDESEIRLSRAMSGIGGLNMINEAYRNAIPVEGKVLSTCKGGFHVEIFKRRAFCPISQIDIRFVDKPEIYVGSTYSFMIKQFEEKGRNIVVSRREILQKEQEKARKAFFSQLAADQVVPGRVTRLMPYGAFVELIPGVEGMVHISELSWSRLEKPEEAVKMGDQVQVRVLGIADGEKAGQKKISLSLKQVTGNPWEQAGDQFQVGQKIQGKVTRCMKFGAFVEMAPGIEGLVHISEMSYTKRVLRPEDEVRPGEVIWVMIKEIDLAKKRVSLSIKDAKGDPWAEVTDKFKIGQTVSGRIEKKEAFGYFISLEPGITGLLPASKIKGSENAAEIERLKAGDSLAVVIDAILPDQRKISLGTTDGRVDDDWRQFSDNQQASLGSLGEKLKQALKPDKP